MPDPTRAAGAGAALVAALLLATTACADATDNHDWAVPSGAHRAPDGRPAPEVDTRDDAVSTFALDVDTGSYTLARASLTAGVLPDPTLVRTEEFVNYFRHDYQPPDDGIAIHVDGTAAPFAGQPDRFVVRVGLQAATVEGAAREPANLTFVIDSSGSMAGGSMEMVKTALDRLVDSLRPDDRVAIVTFSDDARLLLPMTPLTAADTVRHTIAALQPQQSTNLEAGLRVGYAHAREHLRPGALNRVVLLSDGEANVGQTDPQVLARQIAQEAGDDTQLVVVGVGRETYNDEVLERFADNGNGFYAYVDTGREIERLFVHDLTGTLRVVARDAKVQVRFDPELVRSYRLLGYENRQLDDDALRDDTVDGGEVGAGHTVTALYEVTLAAEPAALPARATLASVHVRWTDPHDGRPVERQATVTPADLVHRFAQAPPRLQQDVLVAAFAEALRTGPERADLWRLAAELDRLTRVLREDPDLYELADLVVIAAGLSG